MTGSWRRLGGRTCRPAAASEGGFTLTELLVVVSISSIIMAAIASSFIVGARTEADAYARLQESHDGQLATAYFVADASNTRYFSATLTPPGSNCPDFGTTANVALFEWTDAGTSPPTKKDAFYGVAGSPSQLIRRYCENDALQYEVSLAKNLNGTTSPVVTCPPAPSCVNLPAALQLQVAETSGYAYTLRASPRSIPLVHPVGTFRALIGTGGMTLTNSILKSNGYIIVNAGATCQSYPVTAVHFQVSGTNAGCGPTEAWTSLSGDQFSARVPPTQPAAAAAPSSSSACGGPAQPTYAPGSYPATTLGPGCLATGTYYLTGPGTTILSHVTSAPGGVLIYLDTGDLTLDAVNIGPLSGSPPPYPLTLFMNRTQSGTIRATGTTNTVNGAIYAWNGSLRLTNASFHSDLGTEVNQLIAVNSTVN